MQPKSVLIAGALSVVAVGMLVSGAGSLSRQVGAAQPAAAPEVRFPAVVVVAKRPTASEILDLILDDGLGHSEEARVASVLRKRTADEALVNRVAAALVREGRKANIGATLLVGVLLTENPDLAPRATSSVGARGLMQVMPFHAGKWGCASNDLFDIDANICHGVQILADNLKHSRNLPAALQRYNGCVRGTNTPDCFRYAGKVYRYARRTAIGPGGKVTADTPFSSLN